MGDRQGGGAARDGKGIADADGGLVDAGEGEVFPEGAGLEGVVWKPGAPVGVVVERVDVDRFVGAAVVFQIGRTVADGARRGQVYRAFHRRFDEGRAPGSARVRA